MARAYRRSRPRRVQDTSQDTAGLRAIGRAYGIVTSDDA